MATKGTLFYQIQKIKNSKTSQVKIGANTGSIFSIDFENGLFLMVYASWRISKEGEILTSWRGTDSENLNMHKILKSLEGDKVIKIELSDFYDITLIFEKGSTLTIFCDFNPDYSFDTCWFLQTDKNTYSVNNRNAVEIENI